MSAAEIHARAAAQARLDATAEWLRSLPRVPGTCERCGSRTVTVPIACAPYELTGCLECDEEIQDLYDEPMIGDRTRRYPR